MRRPIRLATFVLVVAAALLAAGCGSEDVGEKIAEKVVENQTGEDVDINVDGDKVKIEGKDGSFEVGASTELPDGWPGDVELPKDAEIVGATSLDGGEGQMLSVTARVVDMTPSEVFDHFEEELDGWTEQTKSVTSSDGNELVIAAWADDGDVLSVTATTDDSNDDEDASTLVATYGPDPGA